MRFELNYVDEIRRTASGKHRFVINLGFIRRIPPNLRE